MQDKDWMLSAADIFSQGPVVPVLVVNDVNTAVPMAKALLAGGIRVLEVTLRTPVAIEVISVIAKEVPEAIVGAGTVINAEQLCQVQEVGAKFAISPGMTKDLLVAGNTGQIALIPGISSISELMTGIDLGYDHFKFFPAEASGGAKAIKSFGGPFPNVSFCPTGGIGKNNYLDYLSLANVKCVGGSWLVPEEALKMGNYDLITELAQQAIAGANELAKVS